MDKEKDVKTPVEEKDLDKVSGGRGIQPPNPVRPPTNPMPTHPGQPKPG